MEIQMFIALGVSLIVGLILCPIGIPILHKMKFGQYVREEGPEAHLKKSGTPTMGGIMIVIAMLTGSAVVSIWYPDVFYVMVFTFLFGVIGLVDDLLKLFKHQSEGLKAWQKMGCQIVVTAGLVICIALMSPCGTMTIIPFLGEIDLGGWFYPIAAVAILGTVNGANFTDGLDGLASSVTTVIAAFFTIAGTMLLSDVVGSSLAMAGALLAFLCFNSYPAKVFMGDTGSLALGGFVAATALMLKMPVFLIIVAFIYLIEILSVMMQVSYFKLTHGKRIFKMTPIHHHFELCGWSETRVVTVFTIITAVLCVVSLIGLKLALQ
ncbi:MAG: phospho-N-acetylmuramoyl-pentapeptide-transferase [Lachnospiraceae bacterium]|nr:phospho-N-acetylmuramoyl-pentapeptide-transferase [Lachnospiraceae bacterium]